MIVSKDITFILSVFLRRSLFQNEKTEIPVLILDHLYEMIFKEGERIRPV